MITRRALVPLIFTMAALVAGFFSLLRAAAGDYLAASQFILLSMILDGLDGKIARVMKATSPIGAEFDTFVDFLSFGVAPSFLAYQAVMREHGAVGLLFCCLIPLSGALRLSRFRVADPHGGQKGYTGLPITVAGGWIAVFFYLSESGAFYSEGLSLERGPLAVFVWFCALAMVFLQVSDVRYPKPTKDVLVFVGGVLGILCLLFHLKLGAIAAAGLGLYGFYLAFVTPFLPRAAVAPLIHDTAEDEDDEEEEAVVPLKRS